MRTPRVPRILLFLCRTRPTGYGDRKMAGPPRKQDRGPIFRLERRNEQTSSLSCERMRNIRDTLQRALSACETCLLLAMKCAKGSLADLLGCMKRRPLHPKKQTFCEAAELVSYVPQADIFLGSSA